MPDALRGMKVKARYDQLAKTDKATLKERVHRSYRVFDSTGVSKDELISYILEAEFGRGYFSDLEAYRDSLKKTLTHVRRPK